MERVIKVKLPTHEDERGPLTVIELKDFVDFDIKRIYYVTDVRLPRGGHAVKHEKKMYVMIRGTSKAHFHDGNTWTEFDLEGPSDALIMNDMCFREFTDFSEDAVLLAVSSVNYVADDYIFDLDEFIKFVKS